MNIEVSLMKLNNEQLGGVISLMSKRDASLEAHLLSLLDNELVRRNLADYPASPGRQIYRLLHDYADKFFSKKERWEEFETKLLGYPDYCDVRLETLLSYMKPRFGGLRWVELEKWLGEWCSRISDSLLAQYSNMINWADPRCDFERPSFIEIANVYKVTQAVRFSRSIIIVKYRTAHVKAVDRQQAEEIAERIDDDNWNDVGDEDEIEEVDEDASRRLYEIKEVELVDP